MAGRRARGAEDLTNRRFTDDGIRPSYLEMLFVGGPAKQTGGMDLRMGHNEAVKPATRQMLFRGGPAKQTGAMDLRMGHNESVLPATREMLAEGGEAEGEDIDYDEGGGEPSEAMIDLAEDLCDALSGYNGPSMNDSDSKVDRAVKEASRRAKAKIIAQIVSSMVAEADTD